MLCAKQIAWSIENEQSIPTTEVPENFPKEVIFVLNLERLA